MGTYLSEPSPVQDLSDCASELVDKWGLNVQIPQDCNTRFTVNIPKVEEYEAISSIVYNIAGTYGLSVLEYDSAIAVSTSNL